MVSIEIIRKIIFYAIHIDLLGMAYTPLQLIELDKLIIDTKYTITINPKDEWQSFNSADRLALILAPNNLRLSKIINDTACLVLYPELSQAGRYHYHGTIEFKSYDNIIKFMLHVIHKLLDVAHVEIDTISDETKWDTYIKKQQIFHNYIYKTYQIATPFQIGIDFVKTQKEFFKLSKKE